jgi:hypothetical protein
MASQVDGLASWKGAEADLSGAVARVAQHPGFPAASRALASGMLELAAADRVLDAIFKDAGRYFAAMWGFALHADGGLTLPRLKAVCERSGLLSPGRARTLLQFLQHCAYIERRVAAAGPDVYVPSPAYLAAWDRHFVASLAAARFIAPGVAALLGADAGAASMRQAYGRIHAAGTLAGMSSEPLEFSVLRVFLHPYAGNHIVWTLLTSDLDPEFPPRRAGPVSMAGLARGCGAARSQVTRIFREADEEGLATLDADGAVLFSDTAREQLRFFYAIQFVQILAAAAGAAELRSLPAG